MLALLLPQALPRASAAHSSQPPVLAAPGAHELVLAASSSDCEIQFFDPDDLVPELIRRDYEKHNMTTSTSVLFNPTMQPGRTGGVVGLVRLDVAGAWRYSSSLKKGAFVTRSYALTFKASADLPCEANLTAVMGAYEDPKMFTLDGRPLATVVRPMLLQVNGSTGSLVTALQIGLIDPFSTAPAYKTLLYSSGSNSSSSRMLFANSVPMSKANVEGGVVTELVDRSMASCGAWTDQEVCSASSPFMGMWWTTVPNTCQLELPASQQHVDEPHVVVKFTRISDKNWAPFRGHNGSLLFLYTLSPLNICESGRAFNVLQAMDTDAASCLECRPIAHDLVQPNTTLMKKMEDATTERARSFVAGLGEDFGQLQAGEVKPHLNGVPMLPFWLDATNAPIMLGVAHTIICNAKHVAIENSSQLLCIYTHFLFKFRGVPPYQLLDASKPLDLVLGNSPISFEPLLRNGIRYPPDLNRTYPYGTHPTAFVSGMMGSGGNMAEPASLLISYGSGDTTSRVLKLSRHEVENLFI